MRKLTEAQIERACELRETGLSTVNIIIRMRLSLPGALAGTSCCGAKSRPPQRDLS
jgi:hypothetical protein